MNADRVVETLIRFSYLLADYYGSNECGMRANRFVAIEAADLQPALGK